MARRTSVEMQAVGDSGSDSDASSEWGSDLDEDEDARLVPEVTRDGRVVFRVGTAAPRPHNVDQDPYVDMQWDLFWRVVPPQLLLGIAATPFAFLVDYYNLGYACLVVAFGLTFLLFLLRGLKSQFLAFVALAINSAAFFFFAYFAVNMINDVIACRSPHCKHGKKWLYDTLFFLVWAILSLLGLECRGLILVLSG